VKVGFESQNYQIFSWESFSNDCPIARSSFARSRSARRRYQLTDPPLLSLLLHPIITCLIHVRPLDLKASVFQTGRKLFADQITNPLPHSGNPVRYINLGSLRGWQAYCEPLTFQRTDIMQGFSSRSRGWSTSISIFPLDESLLESGKGLTVM
jgi:hypothetical protein